jgi:hypothetical protein
MKDVKKRITQKRKTSGEVEKSGAASTNGFHRPNTCPGVRQGDIMSPTICNIVADAAI